VPNQTTSKQVPGGNNANGKTDSVASNDAVNRKMWREYTGPLYGLITTIAGYILDPLHKNDLPANLDDLILVSQRAATKLLKRAAKAGKSLEGIEAENLRQAMSRIRG
jgi:hypothetical protein